MPLNSKYKNLTLILLFFIFSTVFYSALRYLNFNYKQNKLDRELISKFENCGFDNEARSCWIKTFKQYINESSKLKGQTYKIIGQNINKLICESEQFKSEMKSNDTKRICHGVLGLVLFNYESNLKNAFSFCDTLDSEYASSSRFCMSSYFKKYYQDNPKKLTDTYPLNIEYCISAKKYFTNCLKAEFLNYKDDWIKLEKNINSYCDVDDKYKDHCYVAFGAVIAYEKFLESKTEDFSKLCKTINKDYKKYCIKGMLNSFLVQYFDFKKAEQYCRSLNNKKDSDYCMEFVKTGFLNAR